MSTAMQEFERALVSASRTLHAQAQAEQQGAAVRRERRPVTRWGLGRRFRQLNVAVQFGLALSTVSALGGTVAYMFLSTQRTQTIAGVECQLTPRDSAIIDTVTGDPVLDCAAAWPSATGGRSAAPPLIAWELGNGIMAAVVQPAAWGPPAPSDGTTWKRLPAGWTVNLPIVALTDQLNDIAGGLSGAPVGPSGGPGCTYLSRDVNMVRVLLDADHLGSWKVRVRSSNTGASASRDCRPTTPDIDGDAHTVTLIQTASIAPANQARQQHELTAAARANRTLAALDTSVNEMLTRRCASVSSAAALWSTHARAAGLRPTSLAYYRALNAAAGPAASLLYGYYTLITQPASERTGTCAHILVMAAGGADSTVYAARITPPSLIMRSNIRP